MSATTKKKKKMHNNLRFLMGATEGAEGEGGVGQVADGGSGEGSAVVLANTAPASMSAPLSDDTASPGADDSLAEGVPVELAGAGEQASGSGSVSTTSPTSPRAGKRRAATRARPRKGRDPSDSAASPAAGTAGKPYYRQGDGQWVLKYGIVLPTSLIKSIDRELADSDSTIKRNRWIEQKLEQALEEEFQVSRR